MSEEGPGPGFARGDPYKRSGFSEENVASGQGGLVASTAWPYPTASIAKAEAGSEGRGQSTAQRRNVALDSKSNLPVDDSRDSSSVVFTHVRVEIWDEQHDYKSVNPRGGVTVAYAPADFRGGDVFDISTAVCSPVDVYDKSKGRRISMQNFVEGRRIKVRVPVGISPADHLQRMFS